MKHPNKSFPASMPLHRGFFLVCRVFDGVPAKRFSPAPRPAEPWFPGACYPGGRELNPFFHASTVRTRRLSGACRAVELPAGSPMERPVTNDNTTCIRDLNDAFRRSFSGGAVFLTQGVQALDPAVQREAISQVRQFDDFSPDNDPHGEHDFGALTIDGRHIFWKIDYYDLSMEFGSSNPVDPAVTTRVLTVMLAEEY